MKKINIKKYIASALALLAAVTCLSTGSVAFAEELVAINETNFADKNFRTIVSEACDLDENGYLSEAEISRVRTFSPSAYLEDGETVSSLAGIEKFYNLERLYCASMGLTSLDVSKNTKLTSLTCMGNELTTLALGDMPSLVSVNCANNRLKSLDVSGCPTLNTLQASVNALASINLNSNTQLQTLYLYQNELTALNLSANTMLTEVLCSTNHIAELNLSANTMLDAVSSEAIGDQWIELKSTASNNQIHIKKSFTYPSRVISTTMDKVTQTDDGENRECAYKYTEFVTDELDNIANKLTTPDQEVKDGFTYKYDTGNSSCELMTVNVVVNRSSYQVNFYLDQTKNIRLSYDIVEEGDSASAPKVPDAPTCKKFVEWSEDFSNITKDMDIYIVWADDHDMVKSINTDNGDIDVRCRKCDTRTLHFNFFDAYNSQKGDENFVAEGDLNGDGIINAKDYAIILHY